eukprot:CAMPEP_0204329250 /NCGR_PEP_ID=MMETSP0469-20131031/14013_1 /ASSEMBLY_ACC=CAM_ASM_000384 /TAXON_ID=2969 /ORGANISM="Oxyrrhis marina" /LENGTH=287 /DNA_ID=CAMNT_0051311825 /DNA_START=179 /DNA_END=1042 /DNA_ORIENTATION=+
MIKALRKVKDAPVDLMGNEAHADELMKKKDIETFRYQSLICVMLSSQTRDQATAQAMVNLRKHGLTMKNILGTTDAKLKQLIKAVGFANTKVKYIKNTTRLLLNEWGGKVPNTIEGMMTLPGVGPKMGFIALRTGFGRADGIAVDLHLHRLCNLMGWADGKTPEQTRLDLESWLPRRNWAEVNPLIVGLGQAIQQQRSSLIQRAMLAPKPVACLEFLESLNCVVVQYKDPRTKQTPLMWAAESGNLACAKWLLNRGANPVTKARGQSALALARSPAMKRLLLQFVPK